MAVAINESRTKDMIVDVNYVRSLGQIAIRSDLNDAAIMYADAPALPGGTRAVDNTGVDKGDIQHVRFPIPT